MPTRRRKTRVGEVLRQLREQHGLSLRSLAGKVGFSASFLSQVEHGQVSPSIASLERIAVELGVTLADLFQASQPDGLAVTRAGERPGFDSVWSKARVEALIPQSTSRRSLEAIVVTLSPTGTSGEHAAGHTSDQFAYVIRGRLRLFLNDSDLSLDAGDAVLVPRTTRHRWENAGAESAEVLLVSVRLGK